MNFFKQTKAAVEIGDDCTMILGHERDFAISCAETAILTCLADAK